MTELQGFERDEIALGEVRLSVWRGGSGSPLVLLHGYPQTALCWAAVAPALARRFDVILPDLRGYGRSSVPPDDADHTVYSKRRMAGDIVALLDRLGLDMAHVLGHDRGARVAYRMALDHPTRVACLGIVEVVPTLAFWQAFDADLALRAYHWTFLAQPAPLPERLIAGDPVGYLETTLTRWSGTGTLAPFAPAALESYRAQFRDPARVAAMCADYRAGATTDRALDAADRAAGRRIAAPVRVLWAEGGFPAKTGDPLGVWRAWAQTVTGRACPGGHFLPEEAPDAVLETFLPFFDGASCGA